MLSDGQSQARVRANRFLCLPALIEIVLLECGFAGVSQYDIANTLGVSIMPDYRDDRLKNTTTTRIPRLLGVAPDSGKINDLLYMLAVPTRCTFHNSSEFEDWAFEDAIVDEHACGAQVIFCHDHGRLYSSQDSVGVGHAVLLRDISRKAGETVLRVFDPGPEGFGEHSVTAWSMFRSMRAISGGWLVFRRKATEQYEPIDLKLSAL